MKAMTIVGTRPEVIKLSRVIPALDEHTEHVLVHTGQNGAYELNQIFFAQLGIREPDYRLDVARPTVAEAVGAVIADVDRVLERERPDAVLLLGDTNSCLSAYPAKRRRIPIFHMEAGNRSFDERVPEEINRRVVDHLSDVNLPYTEHARRYLLREGCRPELVIKTGSPMREVLDYYMDQARASDVLDRLQLRLAGYLLVSAHREESVDDPVQLDKLIACLSALEKKYELPILVSTHPRTKQRLSSEQRDRLGESVRFHQPFGFLDYVKLQLDAFCVVSDSGTITEESALLNVPAVTIREAHERPEGMDSGVLVMSGLEPDRVLESVDTVTRTHSSMTGRRTVPDYELADVSTKVVRIVLSYTDYVRRVVWGVR